MIVRPDGPIPSRVMIVGEAPGLEEERLGVPFVGASGQELNRMLHEAGIMRSECFVTNVCRVRPPKNDIEAFIAATKKEVTIAHVPLHDKMVLRPIVEGYELLQAEIQAVNPTVIIALGNVALWALTKNWGIKKWRGSLLHHGSIPVIPTWHPALILRQWSERSIAVSDLKRAKRIMDGDVPVQPDWKFTIRPGYAELCYKLEWLIKEVDRGNIEWLDFDLETSVTIHHIKCAGITWSAVEGICIPFMCDETHEGYWPEEEEGFVVYLLYRLLTHPKVKVRGQNLLFDCQYTYRYWHFIPRVAQDTMISHHVCFAGLQKALDFQASMYCDYYTQWKPDKGAWKAGG